MHNPAPSALLGLDAQEVLKANVFSRRTAYEPQESALIRALSFGGIHSSVSTNYVSAAGTAGVDATAQTVVTTVLGPNTLYRVGDRLRVRAIWRGDTGGAITGTAAINGVTVAATTDSGAATLQLIEGWIHFIDSTHANVVAMAAGVLDVVTSAINVAGFNWAATQNITVSQDNVANNHIIVYAVLVDVFPLL